MQIEKHKYFLYFLFAFVLLSRIPFLFYGYGVEEDSWGLALTAHNIQHTGIYEVSRLPGHPLQEYIYSFLWGWGPFVFNLLSALFSSIAAVSFYKLLKLLQLQGALLCTLAFSFIPVVYISSTYTIDFMWAIAVVLASLYFLLQKKYYLSGLLLGLAIGIRITSGAMLIPFAILLWDDYSKKMNYQALLKVTATTLLTGAICFIPVMIEYGRTFFNYHDQFPYPPLAKVIYKASIGVFGSVGLAALAMGFLLILFKKHNHNKLNNKWLYTIATIIILIGISYIRLPQKAGYMIPLLPFVLILFANYLPAKAFKVICILLILSSFTCSVNLTDKHRGASYSPAAITFSAAGQEMFFDVLGSPVMADISKRKLKNNYVQEVITKAYTLNKKAVVISGWWYNQITVTLMHYKPKPYTTFVFYISDQELKKYQSEGYQIYYLEEQDIYNDLMFKTQLSKGMATPFTI